MRSEGGQRPTEQSKFVKQAQAQTIARSLPFGSAARARALAQNKERRSRSRSHSKLRAPLALALSPSKSAALFALSKFFWSEEKWTFLLKITKWQLFGQSRVPIKRRGS